MSYLSNTLSRYTRTTTMGAGSKGLIQKIAGDVPEAKFTVILPDETKKGLYVTAALLGGGIALNGLFNYLK